MKTDNKKLLKQINNWQGCNTEYWQGVQIVKNNFSLKDCELKALNAGLSCFTESFICDKILILRKNIITNNNNLA